MNVSLLERPRRNRQNAAIRSLAAETRLHPGDFVAPFFLLSGEGRREAIHSMPGIERLSCDQIIDRLSLLQPLGIRAIDLFPVIPVSDKDPMGSGAVNPDHFLYTAVREIKETFPNLCVMVDIALDPFTSHGHDGLVQDGTIVNDATVSVLEQMALLAAAAGADQVAPSDMMDGRVGAIRQTLDAHGFTDVGIVSYTAKYASAFYGPFRDAIGSSPTFGDKATYQMDPSNRREALREAELDVREGADMLLVKPALAYLDVIADLRNHYHLPIGAYHVSGEYAMILAAAEKGWIDGPRALRESLLAIKRSGADYIFSYIASSPQWVDQLLS